MATNTKSFVVKRVTPSKKPGGKPFYTEVGRLTMRTTGKGDSGTLYLHLIGDAFAVFPVTKSTEPALEDDAPETDEPQPPPEDRPDYKYD